MAELQALQQLPDEQIDYSDIPKLNVELWAKEARIGEFYRPLKESITIRLDADLLSYFRGKGKGYQTQINEALRSVMTAEIKTVKKTGPTVKVITTRRGHGKSLKTA